MNALLHLSLIKVIGILSIIIGYALRHYVNRQRFYRRSAGGLQGYSSYSKAVTTTFFEKAVKFIGLIFLIIGVLIVLIEWLDYSRTENLRKERERNKIESR